MHQPPPGGELLDEWLGDARRRSRNDDRQVGGAVGHTEGAVADDDGDVTKPDRLQIGPRLLGKVGEALDRQCLQRRPQSGRPELAYA
jgi:hypothetical protein